jgi:hypothetical protein
MKRALILIALLSATPLAAQSQQAPYRVDEIGRSFWRLDDAFKAIGQGNGTVTIAPGKYNDCGSFTGGALMIRAAQPGTVVFDGGICEGKAAMVLRGNSADVSGIIFQNMRVNDKNGSGIRLEKGNLRVTNSIFRNSEQGILTNELPSSSVEIDKVTFSGLGGCPGGMCSHSIYISNVMSLKVTRSRFERGAGGHYVKSRSARVEIMDNSFDDSAGHETNYMIDLPAGATGMITGNTFVQGRSKENYSVMIALGAETRLHKTAGLAIFNNSATLAPGVAKPTNFVADWTREPIKMMNNRIGPRITPFLKV